MIQKILIFAISFYFCSSERFRNDEVPPFGYVSALIIFNMYIFINNNKIFLRQKGPYYYAVQTIDECNITGPIDYNIHRYEIQYVKHNENTETFGWNFTAKENYIISRVNKWRVVNFHKYHWKSDLNKFWFQGSTGCSTFKKRKICDIYKSDD